MQFFKDRLILLLIACFVFLFFINHGIISVLDEERVKTELKIQEQMSRRLRALTKETPPQSATATQKQKKKRRELVPDDPAKYGIISTSKADMPREQAQWDMHMEKIFQESQILQTEEGKEAVEQMGTSEARFDKNLQRINEEIANFEREKSKKPFDETIEKRLQTLYKLKALSNVLKEKVTTRSEDPEYELPQHLDLNPQP